MLTCPQSARFNRKSRRGARLHRRRSSRAPPEDLLTMQSTIQGQNIFVIEAGRSEKNYWLDLWYYRELFLILAWRDISVRYKQTIIGAAWAVIRPFLTMVVFTVMFGRLAGLPSHG